MMGAKSLSPRTSEPHAHAHTASDHHEEDQTDMVDLAYSEFIHGKTHIDRGYWHPSKYLRMNNETYEARVCERVRDSTNELHVSTSTRDAVSSQNGQRKPARKRSDAQGPNMCVHHTLGMFGFHDCADIACGAPED